MEFIEPILSIAKQIYDVAKNVKANKKRCLRVSERVRALDSLVTSIEKREKTKNSTKVEEILSRLSTTLKSTKEHIDKYASAKLVERILKSSSHEDDFDIVNERLDDAYRELSLALQVEQGEVLYKVFHLTQKEKEEDKREDEEELKKREGLLLIFCDAISLTCLATRRRFEALQWSKSHSPSSAYVSKAHMWLRAREVIEPRAFVSVQCDEIEKVKLTDEHFNTANHLNTCHILEQQ